MNHEHCHICQFSRIMHRAIIDEINAVILPELERRNGIPVGTIKVEII